MTDYSELKRLAEAAKRDQHDYTALNDYGMAMPPAVALALIAENERIKAENERFRSLLGECRVMTLVVNSGHSGVLRGQIDAAMSQGEKSGG